MNSPNHSSYRQEKAGFYAIQAQRLARAGIMHNGGPVKVQVVAGLTGSASFRNPSPWRQSGAKLHQLPSLFITSVATSNVEREKLCRTSQNSPLHSRSLRRLQHVSLPINRSQTLRQAPRLAPLSQGSRAEAALTSQQQPLSAVSPAQRCRSSKATSTRTPARFSQHANAALPHLGRAAFCVLR